MGYPTIYRFAAVTTEQLAVTGRCRVHGISPDLTTTGTVTLRDDTTAVPLTPTTPVAVVAAGGSLADATYYFKVVGVDKYGEFTLPSTEVSATTATTNNSVYVTWDVMANASSYRVFFGTASGVLPKYFAAPAGGAALDSFTLTTTVGQLTATIPATATAGTTRLKSKSAIALLQTGKDLYGAVFVDGVTVSLSVATDLGALVYEKF